MVSLLLRGAPVIRPRRGNKRVHEVAERSWPPRRPASRIRARLVETRHTAATPLITTAWALPMPVPVPVPTDRGHSSQ